MSLLLFTDSKTLPSYRTREQVCKIKMTFQGLTVPTKQFGILPWFDAALFSLTKEDRVSAYASKRAAGDTHSVISFDHNSGSIYDEPGQVYQQMNGPAFQDHPDQFLDGLKESISNGFVPSVFLGGDGGEDNYLKAFDEMPQLVSTCKTSYRDFNKDIIIIPGWDGVFYGWPDGKIAEFGQLFRSLSPNGYLGIEHSSGHIPLGNGAGDWSLDGPMNSYDTLLSEFDFPNSFAQGTPEYIDAMGNVWQIAARTLPNFQRPADMPSGYDPHPSYYMAQGTPRGRIYTCAFEWEGEYRWVRWETTPEECMQQRIYLNSLGYDNCTG